MLALNVPNAITVGRILLVPVVVVALLEAAPQRSILAAVVFAVAACTDGLDGWIARATKSETTFGKVMDPIADKLLVAAALIVLVSADRLAAWVAMVIIAREFAVSGLRIYAGQAGAVIAASRLGKWKTTFQIAAVIALIAASDPGSAWVLALVYVSVALTVVSAVDYFVGVRARIAEARERAAAGIGGREAAEAPPA